MQGRRGGGGVPLPRLLWAAVQSRIKQFLPHATLGVWGSRDQLGRGRDRAANGRRDKGRDKVRAANGHRGRDKDRDRAVNGRRDKGRGRGAVSGGGGRRARDMVAASGRGSRGEQGGRARGASKLARVLACLPDLAQMRGCGRVWCRLSSSRAALTIPTGHR